MVLAIIFLVLFAICTAISIYQTVSLTKTPMIEINYRKFIYKNLIFIAGATISFLVASFGFYMWLNANPEAIHVVQLVIGAVFWISSLLIAINAFILHYYGRNIPEKLNKAFYITLMVGFTLSLVMFFVYTNGLAPYLSYPLVNGISFTEGFVTPAPDTGSPNLAFYAICILSGAILVYFICDHYMYQKYGRHGILESTFFVAFPAGIIGARIWYVVGNWSVEFANREFWHVFAIWEGGITILGGAIMGIVVGVAWFMWRNKGLSIWYAIDMIVPTILIAQAVGRWGNFFNCEVHGLVTSIDNFKWLPEIIWRNAQYSSTSADLRNTNQMYVPLFFIEGMINLFGFFLLAHVFGKALGKYKEPGDLGGGYVIWYGLTRVLLEPLRDNSFQMGENGYWSWVWSMIFVLAGTLYIVLNHVVRTIIKTKKGTYEAKPCDTKVGIISTAIIVIISAVLITIASILMTKNSFVTKVEYNGFNAGLMILVLGVSALTTLGISLPILFKSLKKQVVVNNE